MTPATVAVAASTGTSQPGSRVTSRLGERAIRRRSGNVSRAGGIVRVWNMNGRSPGMHPGWDAGPEVAGAQASDREIQCDPQLYCGIRLLHKAQRVRGCDPA